MEAPDAFDHRCQVSGRPGCYTHRLNRLVYAAGAFVGFAAQCLMQVRHRARCVMLCVCVCVCVCTCARCRCVVHCVCTCVYV